MIWTHDNKYIIGFRPLQLSRLMIHIFHNLLWHESFANFSLLIHKYKPNMDHFYKNREDYLLEIGQHFLAKKLFLASDIFYINIDFQPSPQKTLNQKTFSCDLINNVDGIFYSPSYLSLKKKLKIIKKSKNIINIIINIIIILY